MACVLCILPWMHKPPCRGSHPVLAVVTHVVYGILVEFRKRSGMFCWGLTQMRTWFLPVGFKRGRQLLCDSHAFVSTSCTQATLKKTEICFQKYPYLNQIIGKQLVTQFLLTFHSLEGEGRQSCFCQQAERFFWFSKSLYWTRARSQPPQDAPNHISKSLKSVAEVTRLNRSGPV